MSFRVLVDTDVILDLLLPREPFFAAAARLFLLVQNREIEACVTPVIFSNLFYVLRKEPSTPPEAIAALRKLRLITRVLSVDEGTIDQALASTFTDFEDAIQYYAALAQDLHAVVTRNKQDYRSARLPILTAEECVALYRSRAH